MRLPLDSNFVNAPMTKKRRQAELLINFRRRPAKRADDGEAGVAGLGMVE